MLPEASGWHEEKNKLERNRNIRFFGRAISAPSQGPDRLQRTTFIVASRAEEAKRARSYSYAFIRRRSSIRRSTGSAQVLTLVWNLSDDSDSLQHIRSALRSRLLRKASAQGSHHRLCLSVSALQTTAVLLQSFCMQGKALYRFRTVCEGTDR